MHMLVLDDDPQVGKFLARVATDLGWTADQATTPDAFQAHYARRYPDLVGLDLQLGASDGIEQLRFLHGAGFLNPIVLTSGFDERVLAAAEQLGTSLGLNIAGVLPKPVRANTVREFLQSIEDKHAPITAQRIAAALASDQMRLEYQPIVDARTQQVHHMEALVRWALPGRVVTPGEFVDVAEKDAALIHHLTEWIARAALTGYRALESEHLAVPVAINVSGATLHRPDFPDFIARAIAEAGVPPQSLQLEVTESVATADPIAMLDILTRLRLKGISVAIDDFGTGFSSLVALHRLPFTEIKIDRCFVAEAIRSHESRTIVRSVADLARNLKLRSVAEGVETQAIAETLREIGVDLLQGYFFSKPLPLEELASWLRGWACRRSAIG